MSEEIEKLFDTFRLSPFVGGDPNAIQGYGVPDLANIQPGAFPDLGHDHVRTDLDGVSVTDDALQERVRLGRLPSGDYGLRVVSSDGSTVIIDGTSDMFRIAATGTLNANGPAGALPSTLATVNTSVDVATGFTYTPFVAGYLNWPAGSTTNTPLTFVGYYSDGTLARVDRLVVWAIAGAQTRVQWTCQARADYSPQAATVRYYILEQVAI